LKPKSDSFWTNIPSYVRCYFLLWQNVGKRKCVVSEKNRVTCGYYGGCMGLSSGPKFMSDVPSWGSVHRRGHRILFGINWTPDFI
jgi:hypothetical protein